ncbi:CPBP family intramembrane metalloprotease [Legionella nagasakiensis]|uniref:CPBP family intramembrane metalloprotease n=1 Tax=Legionella nagasakiensis TaxID=535290 RepID=UPI001055B2BE|nr:CPBP family intramembrane metalloprotease [Legionella nagasakiensis]
MAIHWPLVIVLFVLSLPGVLIAIPRLINLLLKSSSLHMQKRLGKLAIGQTLLMVFVMSIAGSVLSASTGLNAPLLDPLLQGNAIFTAIQDGLFPVFLYTLGGLVVFLILYYGLVSSFLDEATLNIMKTLRGSLGLDGCMLYGGVVEEILARWGLMNLTAFFAILFTGQRSPLILWSAILISGGIYTLSHIPAYLAAGCQATHRFLYSLVLLNGWQAILFGLLFWHYGLLFTIVAHMLFHLGWWLYDKPKLSYQSS